MIYDFVLPDPCTVSAFVLLVPCALCFSLLTVCLLARPLCFPVCARARVGSVPRLSCACGPLFCRTLARAWFGSLRARARTVWFHARSRAHWLVPCALARALARVSVGSRARVPCPRAWFPRVFGAYLGSYVLNNDNIYI